MLLGGLECRRRHRPGVGVVRPALAFPERPDLRWSLRDLHRHTPRTRIIQPHLLGLDISGGRAEHIGAEDRRQIGALGIPRPGHRPLHIRPDMGVRFEVLAHRRKIELAGVWIADLPTRRQPPIHHAPCAVSEAGQHTLRDRA